jgi:hypothetical protein
MSRDGFPVYEILLPAPQLLVVLIAAMIALSGGLATNIG